MASEYLKWKYRDVKPDPPPPSRTRKQKLENWFHYNKWWLVVGAVLIWIVGSMLWNALGIGQVKPDYIFAYIGRDELPPDSAADLETALASLGEDVNGDGKVVVELRQYATNRSGDLETALYYNYASDTLLLADITSGDSRFFLVEDPLSVQLSYQIFAQADGTPPAEGDFEVADKVFLWSACPALSSLPLDQELFSGLSLGRRCFYEERPPQLQQADDAFWQLITKGAER